MPAAETTASPTAVGKAAAPANKSSSPDRKPFLSRLLRLGAALSLALAVLTGVAIAGARFYLQTNIPCKILGGNSNNNLMVAFGKVLTEEAEGLRLFGGFSASVPRNMREPQLAARRAVSQAVHRRVWPAWVIELGLLGTAFLTGPAFLAFDLAWEFVAETTVLRETVSFFCRLLTGLPWLPEVPGDGAGEIRIAGPRYPLGIRRPLTSVPPMQAMRVRFYDELLENELHKGTPQLVHIGAGLDLKPAKLVERLTAPGVGEAARKRLPNILELDLPHTIEVRRCVLDTVLGGQRSGLVQTHGCDLMQHTIHSCLAAEAETVCVGGKCDGDETEPGQPRQRQRLDPAKPAAFVEEATFIYLPKARRAALLQDMLQRAACGSTFTFMTFCYRGRCASPLSFEYDFGPFTFSHEFAAEGGDGAQAVADPEALEAGLEDDVREVDLAHEMGPESTGSDYDDAALLPPEHRTAIKRGLVRAVVGRKRLGAPDFCVAVPRLRLFRMGILDNVFALIGEHADVQQDFAKTEWFTEQYHGYLTMEKRCDCRRGAEEVADEGGAGAQ